MLRTCPRCGDYFAGDAPPFCPADGTPLADVGERGEGWEEGGRVVEEKTRLARRRVRRLRLRRVLTTVMTLVVMIMVVYVVAANYVVYLKPDPEAHALLAAVTPSPSPPWPTPVPLPKRTATPATPTPTITPPPTCTDEDRLAAEGLIVRENRERWEKAIAAEAPEIIKRYVPPVSRARGDTDKGGGAEPGTPTYHATFTEDCQSATVTATYSWRVTWEAGLGREKGNKTVEDKKSFDCSKDAGAWRCP